MDLHTPLALTKPSCHRWCVLLRVVAPVTLPLSFGTRAVTTQRIPAQARAVWHRCEVEREISGSEGKQVVVLPKVRRADGHAKGCH